MTRLIPFALLLVCTFFSGCQRGKWYEVGFPWREAHPGETQSTVNSIITEACPYNGLVSILCRPGYYSSPNPARHKTRVDVNAWLKAPPQKNILSETLWIDAYRLEVVDRMGDASGTKIILKDVIDAALYEIILRFDPTANTLQIVRMSDNIKK